MKRFLLAALAACGMAHAADPVPPSGLRLGDAATPHAYRLQLSIDPAEPAFAGEVRIEMLVNRETDVLWMNAKDLDIESVSFTQGLREVPVKVHRAGEERVGFEATGERFVFGTTEAVIRYRGRLPDTDTRGIFRRREAGEWYAVSQFESMSARRALPSFDEPAWKTTWDVTIDTPAANKAFSNAPEVAAEDAPDRPGWKRHRFARTPKLPTYLVAVAIGPWDVLDGGKAGARPTPLRFIAPKGRAGEARFARTATPDIVRLLEAYFGTPHPFDKLDSLALAGRLRFGAMENAGLVTYEPGILLARPQDESLAFQRRYVSVGAHEVAHQWVGDLVTLAWWDDVWLNEAFASWLARKTARALHPEWEGGWRHGETRRGGLAADRLSSARQVRNPVRDRNDLSGAFDAITYSKGAEVLSMFESWLGEDAFRRGVRQYMARHAGGNATSDDFFRALGEAAGRADETVAALRSFVDQPGLPLVDVSLVCDRGPPALRLSQRRFAGLGRESGTQRWTVPACFRYRASGKTLKQCVAIGADATVPLEAVSCPDWVVGNADGAGHWVARYDAALLRSLEARLVDLPENEAVALAGDMTLLVRSGLLARDAGWRFADEFLRHPSLGVRHGGIDFLETQREEMLGGAQRQARHALLVNYVFPMARSFGWLDRPGDSLPTQELRAAVMAYAARVEGGEPLRASARELAMRWVGERTALPASSAPAVMRTAGRFADASTFQRLQEALAVTQEGQERATLIAALALAREPGLRARALELALREASPGGLEPAEALLFMETLLGDDANRVAGFAFLRDRWDAWVAKLPPETAARLIEPLAGLCTRRDRQDFVAFFQDRVQAMRGAPRKYAQALEAIDICIAAASAPGEPAAAPLKKKKARARRGRS